MKILSAQQIHNWDAYTIANEPITSIDLMERAATTCTNYVVQQDLFGKSFKIFCGKGNNGGDGLAIARQLLQQRFDVSVYIIEFGAVGTEDFQTNLQRLHELTANIHFIQGEGFFPVIDKNDVVIDALFGSGLNRPLKDLSAALVQHINQSMAFVISIDVPSGMFIDKSSINNAVVRANVTLTFQQYKLCFLVAENAENTGKLIILDIGLLPGFLDDIETVFQTADAAFIQQIYKPRKHFSHKGTYGHALIIAGNTGKMGAALMAAHACLRAGAGLTTLNILSAFLNAVHAHLPEAMCQLRENGLSFEKINAVALGPGLGTEDDSLQLIEQTLNEFKLPAVIDADALNLISTHKRLLKLITAGSILTPHPKEFERLFGKAENDFERIDTALKKSAELNCIIILKGTYTLIAHNGKGWFNTTGNAGLAKGGSGDILTGIITALLAQKYSPFEAALMGVYLHGLAADITLETQSQESMLATDVVNSLGAAFGNLLLG
ncbi:NAD(P)H-hydrate dehydratase [Parafilimonas sp.]|uniref:NAD(P)H-hydrate dehydratase n=1 Tax=Parafilimonas sp. TaxID=1969739 RepID=UPI003F7F086D